MPTEVMTIQNISNTFPFSNKYCQAVTYNNYIYVNTGTAIYRYDYINNISTLIYTKTYSSYSIDSSFTPICIKDDILYWGSHIGYKNGRYDYNEWVYIGTYNLLNNTVNEKYMTVREVLHNSSTNASLYSGRGFMYIKDNYIYLNQAISAYITVGYDNAVYEINTDTNTYVRTGLSYVPMSNLDYGYYASTEYIGSSYTYTNRFGEVQGRSNSLITTLSGNTIIENGLFKRNNKIYILGGYNTNSSSSVNTIRVFDLTNNSYTTLTETLPENKRTPAVAQVDENTYYIILNTYITIIHFEVYDYKYTFYDNSGSTVYHVSEDNAPTTKLHFNFTEGTSLVGYVLTEVTGTVSGTFSIDIPENKTLAGFALSPNSNIISIPLNVDVTYATTGDTAFYAVFTTYRPPARTFGVNLYQYSAEDNRVDKTSFLTNVATLLGALRTECSIIRPTIDIQFEDNYVPTCNYIYIPIFQRYYFIRNITSVRQKIWRFECEIDVLMTYKTGILGLDAYIARQENDYNNELVDNQLPCEKQSEIMVFDPSDGYDIGTFNNQLEDGAHNFVLTVVGA